MSMPKLNTPPIQKSTGLGNAPIIYPASNKPNPLKLADTENEEREQDLSSYQEYKQSTNATSTEKQPFIKLINGLSKLKLEPINWLVKNMVESGTITGMFGAPASGKSFLALDLALCIASGKPFYGNNTNKGSVVYFAGEGLNGLKRRLKAWMQSNKEFSQEVDANFYLAERACLLPDEQLDIAEQLKTIPDLRLIVLDTLQRTMIGDENSTKDMSEYIRALDYLKQCLPNVTVLLIHHTGHGDATRARGSSVLKASLDTEVIVTKDASNVIELKCTKTKDAEEFKPFYFKLTTQSLTGEKGEILTGEEGEVLTSAILTRLENHQQAEDWRKKVSAGKQSKAMTILETLYTAQTRSLELSGYDPETAKRNVAVRADDWAGDCVEQGLCTKRSLFRRDVAGLLERKGVISTKNGYVYINGEKGEKGEVLTGEEAS